MKMVFSFYFINEYKIQNKILTVKLLFIFMIEANVLLMGKFLQRQLSHKVQMDDVL